MQGDQVARGEEVAVNDPSSQCLGGDWRRPDSVGADAAGQLLEGAYIGWPEGGCTSERLSENIIGFVRAQDCVSSRPGCRTRRVLCLLLVHARCAHHGCRSHAKLHSVVPFCSTVTDTGCDPLLCGRFAAHPSRGQAGGTSTTSRNFGPALLLTRRKQTRKPSRGAHLAVSALSNLLDAGVRALNAAAAPKLIVAAASAGHFDGPFQRDVRCSLCCHGATAGEIRLLSATCLPAACCLGSSRPGPVALLLPGTGLDEGPDCLALPKVCPTLKKLKQHC